VGPSCGGRSVVLDNEVALSIVVKGMPGLGRRSRDGPAGVLAGEPEVDQPAEVERCHPGVQPEVVGGHASVAQLAAAAFGADQPGDGAFDHGPVLAVVGAQVVTLGPVAARLARSASCSCRCRVRPRVEVVHRWRSGQPRQAMPKLTRRVRVSRRVTPLGQVAVPAASSTAIGNSATVTSRVHYGNGYVNANWNGSTINYGDGPATATPFGGKRSSAVTRGYGTNGKAWGPLGGVAARCWRG
jgi:Thermolysin metallopeptidase, catalytic domain